MTPRILAAALALAFLPSAATGADLLNVYRDALVSDPAYQSARALYKAGLEKLPQARAGILPTANLLGTTTRNNVEADVAEDSRYTSQVYSVSLTQPLFRWQNRVAVSQAEQAIVQTEATFATAKQDLIVRVAQAYFDVLLAQDNVALSEAQKKAISEQLAQAKRNFEVGTSTIVDTLEAQARYDQAVAKEIADLNDLQVKRQALQQLIGKPAGALATLRDRLTLAEPSPNNIDAWVKTAGHSSFSVAIARAAHEISRQEVDRARAGHYPTVDLSASYVHSRLAGLQTSTGAVGLVVGVPLFAGGATQSRIREALALRDKGEQDLEGTQRTVAQLVRQNFLNVTSGISQVRALEQALASTQSQLDSTILGRDVGVRTSVDVLNAQQQVFQTRRDLQQARYNFLMNTLRLKAATGTLAEGDVEEVNRALARG